MLCFKGIRAKASESSSFIVVSEERGRRLSVETPADVEGETCLGLVSGVMEIGFDVQFDYQLS